MSLDALTTSTPASIPTKNISQLSEDEIGAELLRRYDAGDAKQKATLVKKIQVALVGLGVAHWGEGVDLLVCPDVVSTITEMALHGYIDHHIAAPLTKVRILWISEGRSAAYIRLYGAKRVVVDAFLASANRSWPTQMLPVRSSLRTGAEPCFDDESWLGDVVAGHLTQEALALLPISTSASR
jgi:hypothetical protein